MENPHKKCIPNRLRICEIATFFINPVQKGKHFSTWSSHSHELLGKIESLKMFVSKSSTNVHNFTVTGFTKSKLFNIFLTEVQRFFLLTFYNLDEIFKNQKKKESSITLKGLTSKFVKSKNFYFIQIGWSIVACPSLINIFGYSTMKFHMLFY